MVTTGGVAEPRGVIQFTSTTNVFLRLESMTLSRSAHGCSFVKTTNLEALVVAGGWSGAPLDTAEIYNYATSSWSLLPSMANARGNFPHMFLLGMRLIVLGGASSPNDKVVEELDMNSEPMVWTEVPGQLKKGRNSAGATTIPTSKFCQ